MDGEEKAWRPPLVYWAPFILCAVLLFVVDFYQSDRAFDLKVISHMTLRHPFYVDDLQEEASLKGFLVKTSGCRIAEMDPYDPTVREYIEEPENPFLHCNSDLPALVESNATSLYVLNSSLDDYSIDDVDLLSCCYSPLKRVDPEGRESDDGVIIAERCFEFVNSTRVSHEFVRVRCYWNETLVYTDYFSFVPPKFKASQWKKKTVSPRPLNVLVIGLDAVSRVNLHRQMPKTVEVLKERLNSYELLGYNKVGDNTFPNLVPLLTGMTEQELWDTCRDRNLSKFDACPFIWKEFKRRGFVTSFAEDASWMGMFNYGSRNGFVKQPTDYYWKTINHYASQDIGNNHLLNVNLCLGARPQYTVLLQYIKKFVIAMHEYQRPYFAFFWGASLSHDNLNFPRLGDEDYVRLFEYLHRHPDLNRTVILFLSDHGIRWGGIRQTRQGMLEERLPFVFVILPEWYKAKYAKLNANLRKNTRRLTTPFDLYETLRDLLDPYQLTNTFLTKREQTRRRSRGYSLFESIPENRTCESANISSHWCTCQESTTIENNATIVKEAAEFTVSYINDKLSGFYECHPLTLKEVLNARAHYHGELEEKENNARDFTITLVTVPGDATFEVTIRQQFLKKKTFSHEIPYKLNVMGTVSRLNLYGKQSACVADFHMKLYCYCKT